MPVITTARVATMGNVLRPVKTKRIESIDLLRGIVMIIMAIDHTRDYFHASAFMFEPTDLARTSVPIFLTRWITHYCAPIFVFLAGLSAYLYGEKRTKKELSFFLLTRGVWLVFVELFIISLSRTFNPAFTFVNLQVIWAIGISMIVLSALVYLPRYAILLVAFAFIAGHNLLDNVHVPGDGPLSFIWALLHDPARFNYGPFLLVVRYPLLPWIGIIALGYYFGSFYARGYDAAMRREILLALGFGAITLFIVLRGGNFYGDAAHFELQQSAVFSFLSFLNTTKYPPSLLYILMTLGPAFIFLALAERPLNAFTEKIALFGRVPMFYYIAHIFLIHFLALFAVAVQGYDLSDMILSSGVNASPKLKGYGFNLLITYLVWLLLIIILYPLCKWFDGYKRTYLQEKRWLSYL